MALHDWNTTFPPTDGITEAANQLGDQGLDVHTVMIELDNGGWRVDMLYTDEDMQDGLKQFELSNNGGLIRF